MLNYQTVDLLSIIICRIGYFDDAFIISTRFTPLKFDKRRRHFLKYPFQLAYLEVLGGIFTCTFMSMSTFGKTQHADTLVRSFSVIARWNIDVTLVVSSFTLVYVCKSRVNAELSTGFVRFLCRFYPMRIDIYHFYRMINFFSGQNKKRS